MTIRTILFYFFGKSNVCAYRSLHSSCWRRASAQGIALSKRQWCRKLGPSKSWKPYHKKHKRRTTKKTQHIEFRIISQSPNCSKRQPQPHPLRSSRLPRKLHVSWWRWLLEGRKHQKVFPKNGVIRPFQKKTSQKMGRQKKRRPCPCNLPRSCHALPHVLAGLSLLAARPGSDQWPSRPCRGAWQFTAHALSS